MAEEAHLNFRNEICVLLIEHDKESLIHTTKLLEACSYKVVAVEDNSVAMWKLYETKKEIDFVLADTQVPGLDPYTLLHIATELGVRTILMCRDKDDEMITRGMESGAYMVLEKPISVETLKYLWQHAMREKTSSKKAAAVSEKSDHNGESQESEKNSLQIDIRKRTSGTNDGSSTSTGISRKRICFEWKGDVHEKFVHAVQQLGEGRCYPKEIHELMNVPGLTRIQVASHLQKCRYGLFGQRSKESKPKAENPQSRSQQRSTRRSGCMPVELRELENPQTEKGEKDDNAPPLAPPPGFADITKDDNIPTMSNVVNQNERPDLNFPLNCVPVIPDLNLAAPWMDSHAGSSSTHRQQQDNYVNFLPEDDEDIIFLYERHPDGSMTNQISRTQCPEELSLASSGKADENKGKEKQ